MENTHDYVEKLQADKKKAEKNYKNQGSGHPDKKLPNAKHNKR